ncbi:protein of unknown function [Pseudomonas sp. JV551A1]|uniref:Uncharacterized protein n=1 Tax=Pseudomonas inefficax TaxID=2078786 RepID=A0AAQ1PB62_9PSED|nr:protein of unknown function [Pseudomonas sp. JV551A1]SPO62435.1 protein of unknown function [Pseudomonas inefficax]
MRAGTARSAFPPKAIGLVGCVGRGWEVPLRLAYLVPDLPAFRKVRLFFVTLPMSKWRAETRV